MSSTTRTEKDILTDLREAQEAYAALAANEDSTQAQLRDAIAAIKALNKELGEYLVRGANNCDCGAVPMGMLKTPAYFDQARGVDFPNIWEVGCVHCPPYLVAREDGKALVLPAGTSVFEHDNPGAAIGIGEEGATMKVKRRSLSARAVTTAEAVRKWNEKEWVEDFYFDRIPGFKPEHAAE